MLTGALRQLKKAEQNKACGMEDVAGGMTDTEDVAVEVAWSITRRRVVRFEPATEEQIEEWKEGKRPLWRFELMWPDGEWETQGMCDRVEC